MSKNKRPFIIIAGPCVIENRKLTLSIAQSLQKSVKPYQYDFYFKASYDKANRTSLTSYRGLGLSQGLEILREVKETYGVKVLSDVHSVKEIEAAARVLDVIQIPAFLSRQTDLLVAAAQTGKIVNIKKAQFMSPFDMKYAVDKVEKSGTSKIFLTERGTTFGYNNLVVDFRSLKIMRALGHPVIFDATHSVQLPSLGQGCSSGEREYIMPLARAAVAFGCDGVFMEVHPNPAKALCDGANSLNLKETEKLLEMIKAIQSARTKCSL